MKNMQKCPKCYSYYDADDELKADAHKKDPCGFVTGDTFRSARRRYWTVQMGFLAYVVGRMNSDTREYIQVVDVRPGEFLSILIFDGGNQKLERDIVESVTLGGGVIKTDLDLEQQTDRMKKGLNYD